MSYYLKQYLLLYIVRKNDDSGQDDDSLSIISNEVDDIEEETEQIQYTILDKNLFGIRRRRTKIVDKVQVPGIEVAKDALENIQPLLNPLTTIRNDYSETEPSKKNDKVKCAVFVLFAIFGCYFSYKFIPIYIVSF